jgi:ATP-dependent exoDNAse (exonuclease V) beta subunit
MKQNRLNKIIHDLESKEFATHAGTDMHAQMAKIKFYDGDFIGPADIISKIKSNAELFEIMGSLSRAEVPLAGYVDGTFLSRRIDRLYVNKNTKTIIVLDYKTDIDRKQYYEKYRVQLTEYYKLLKEIFPMFNIKCKILWLNDFTLENVI